MKVRGRSMKWLILACMTLPVMAPAAEPGEAEAFGSIASLQAEMKSGALTAAQLTDLYLRRITELDGKLHSVIEINPDARVIANTPHAGPLAGIPILLKDNIDTGDRMLTTAGSLALVAAGPARQDATVAEKLRKAGAILLGKANLSEWANFRSTHSSSGWSGRGGQTHNAYVLDRNPCGSSAGSGASVAAGLAVAAIGSETDGSILCPSAANGLVGIKPTIGLVSRAGVVPISHNQDTTGPMTRNVADAAAILTVIAGSDKRDPMTAEADAHATDYTKFVNPDGLRGKRIGVVRKLMGRERHEDKAVEEAIEVMKAQGAIIVDNVELPHLDDLADERMVLAYDFKHDIAAYLATRPGAPKTLADLIAFNKANADKEMPWFDQEIFEDAESRGDLSDPKYVEAQARIKRLAGPEGIDAALAANHLDALLGSSAAPPCPIDMIAGGGGCGGGSSRPAAVAGYPSITVPAGYIHDLPLGVTFFGAKWSEGILIAIASGYEAHGPKRVQAKLIPTISAEK
jgi:amidase